MSPDGEIPGIPQCCSPNDGSKQNSIFHIKNLIPGVACDTLVQGGITCGAIDEPRKSSKAIDEHVIINFRDKNVVIARFRDKNVYR